MPTTTTKTLRNDQAAALLTATAAALQANMNWVERRTQIALKRLQQLQAHVVNGAPLPPWAKVAADAFTEEAGAWETAARAGLVGDVLPAESGVVEACAALHGHRENMVDALYEYLASLRSHLNEEAPDDLPRQYTAAVEAMRGMSPEVDAALAEALSRIDAGE